MIGLTGYLLLFMGVGVFFLFFHLMLGKLVRPNKPDPDKLTIYECGEPTIGSAWVQFDLRYYVVALLFVIFDVEVAFFFPWAVVFGKANSLAQTDVPQTAAEKQAFEQQVRDLAPNTSSTRPGGRRLTDADYARTKEGAKDLAWFAFWDILVFFGVLLVGFAYLWKRGDIDWVRSTAAEKAAEGPALPAEVRGQKSEVRGQPVTSDL
jgi:NADH-quinone oxidoreductase subunit A